MIRFIGTYLKLQSIIIANNQWLPKTRSIPYWNTSVFFSTATDLVLIYESVTSSASVVSWLTLHNWTLNFCILLRINQSRKTAPLRLNRSSLHDSLYRLPVTMENVCCHGNVLIEPLASNCFILCCGNMCLVSRWLSMDFRSVYAIPAFRHHVTIISK
jgi:hypothetical protein